MTELHSQDRPPPPKLKQDEKCGQQELSGGDCRERSNRRHPHSITGGNDRRRNLEGSSIKRSNKPGRAVGARHDQAWAKGWQANTAVDGPRKRDRKEEEKQYHKFLMKKTADNSQPYQIEKKSVASAKAAHYAGLNEKLESRKGGRMSKDPQRFAIARARI
ncbi:unnamed protein product [Haemonchus placei]|uniref:SMAP domain-containing protein n=1 Tax=Haemonchus placei TaxID=6290 RepID=A0A0N4WLP2_HAEPC|nr:unnamed protein product [Haemonchus placei]